MRVFLKTTKGVNKVASEDRVLVGREVFSEQEACRHIKQGHILLADGVGGNNAGAVAAFQVCKKMAVITDPTEESFSAINEHILSMSALNENYRNMATTATGMYFESCKNAIVYHVGNTRLYAIQAGEYLKQLTADDTVVNFLIRTGKLNEEEATTYPARNEITACFGGGKKALLRVKKECVDMTQFHQFLLTCDGIHDYLTIDEMENILCESNGDWSKAVSILVEHATSNGSTDDCSAVIVDCLDESYEDDYAESMGIGQAQPGYTVAFSAQEKSNSSDNDPVESALSTFLSNTDGQKLYANVPTAKAESNDKRWHFFGKKRESRQG